MSKGIAVQIGAGNIGRGFVGEILQKNGFELVFLDADEKLVAALKGEKGTTYKVVEIEAGPDGTNIENPFVIKVARAIDSRRNPTAAAEELKKAAIITCAVGPNVIPRLGASIAKAIHERTAQTPVIVIACENAVYATNTLRGFIEEEAKKLEGYNKEEFLKKVVFANSAVDRIVPKQPEGVGLDVHIEKFHEWCVEKKPFEAAGIYKTVENIDGIHFVDDLGPYIERKLFTVNTGHATAAYFGRLLGYKYVHEAMANKEVVDKVKAVLQETAAFLIDKYGLTREAQNEYISKILARFSNKAFVDELDRVGRAPLRKLYVNDRIISPALQIEALGGSNKELLTVIPKALKFLAVPGDDESLKLVALLLLNDAETAAKKITGLTDEAIEKAYKDSTDDERQKLKQAAKTLLPKVVELVEAAKADYAKLS